MVNKLEVLQTLADSTRDAKGVEVQSSNEKEMIQKVSDQFNRFQMMNFNEHMHCLRGTHLKTQVRLVNKVIWPRSNLKPGMCHWQVHCQGRPTSTSASRHVRQAWFL